jgi:hypothetical protein
MDRSVAVHCRINKKKESSVLGSWRPNEIQRWAETSTKETTEMADGTKGSSGKCLSTVIINKMQIFKNLG